MTEQDSQQIAKAFVKHVKEDENSACPICEVANFFSQLSLDMMEKDRGRAMLIMDCYASALTSAVCQQESGVEAIATEAFRKGIDNLAEHAGIVIHLGNFADLHSNPETLQ